MISQRQHARRNAKERHDPTTRLELRHTFREGDTNIDTDQVFSSDWRSRGVTFKIRYRQTAGTSNGVLIELGAGGAGANGMAICLAGDDQLVIGAGDGGVLETGGISCATGSISVAEDLAYEAIVSINPAVDKLKCWVNGVDQNLTDLIITGAVGDVGGVRNYAKSFTNMGQWCGAANGAVGQVNGTITEKVSASVPGVAAAVSGALTNATVEYVNVYYGAVRAAEW